MQLTTTNPVYISRRKQRWEQLAIYQTDPQQVVPRQQFTPYDCLLISVAPVVFCCVDCLWVNSVIIATLFENDLNNNAYFRNDLPLKEKFLC